MARRHGNEAAAFWGNLIERQATSGLSIWRFCDRAGVSTASFHAWKRKLKFRSKSPGRCNPAVALSPLVPVRVIGETGSPVIAVELPGGIVVRVPANGDSTLMRAAAHFACELARGVTGPC
jgi:hypothetical protein